MNANNLGNMVLLGYTGLAVIIVSVAPSVAFSLVIMGVGIKMGLGHFTEQMQKAERRRKKRERRNR